MKFLIAFCIISFATLAYSKSLSELAHQNPNVQKAVLEDLRTDLDTQQFGTIEIVQHKPVLIEMASQRPLNHHEELLKPIQELEYFNGKVILSPKYPKH